MENPLVFKFIKTADKLNEEHPLYEGAIEDTIAKLGLPYAMAMAYRISMRKNLTDEQKQIYIAELREHQQSIIAEQEELQARFFEHLQQAQGDEDKEAQEAQQPDQEDIPINEEPDK